MSEPKNQTLKPFSEGAKDEGLGSAGGKTPVTKTRGSKEEKEDDSPKKKYRVLTQHAVVNGEKYSDADKDGAGYGTVELTAESAREHQKRGVGLAEVK